MCIRDRCQPKRQSGATGLFFQQPVQQRYPISAEITLPKRCLLYTSDAADERSSVDLGGRRIIKKKKIKHVLIYRTYMLKTN